MDADLFYKDILERIEQVVGKDQPRPVLLHAPFMNGNEQKYVAQTIEENWVSSAGAFVTRLEEDLARFCGVNHAVAVVNGTAALHASLYVLGIGQGDDVLVPSLTFVASANAIMHAGATPHLVECDPDTLGLDVDMLDQYLAKITTLESGKLINKDTGRTIKAIMPVHIFGAPADIDRIDALAKKYNLIMIQDSTEALGSTYKGETFFHYGACAALSFNGNKIITSGGGGAILTNDAELAQKLKHVTTTSKQAHAFAFFHDAVGYNYRMPNINAALACAQLEQMPDFLRRKKALSAKYKAAFSGFAHATYMEYDDSRGWNCWLNAIKIHKQDKDAMFKGLEFLAANGIQARPLWTPMHQLPMYAGAPRMQDLSVTEAMAASIINLPSSAFL